MNYYDLYSDLLRIQKMEAFNRAHFLQMCGYQGVRCQADKPATSLLKSAAFLGSDGIVYDVGCLHDPNLLPSGVTPAADGYIDCDDNFVRRGALMKSDALQDWIDGHRRHQETSKVDGARQAVGHMLGTTHESLLHAARLLAPADTEPVEVKDCGDAVEAALRAYGLEATAANRDKLLALVSEAVAKAEDFRPALIPMTAEPISQGSQKACDAIGRAEAAGLIYEARLGGKHSSGTAVIMDPESEALWLLKPGSGPQSPGAGISDTDTSQSRREVATATVGRRLVPANFPESYLVNLGGHEVAAIRVVPRDAVPVQRLQVDARQVFGPHVADGSLFQWAAIDWVMGNVDRHSGNILAAPGRGVYLIDHGSTLAGAKFDPAHDSKSFVPFYLRAWAPTFRSMDVNQRRAALPDVNPNMHQAFRHWIHDVFTPDVLAPVKELAPDAYEAVYARLHDLQTAEDPLKLLLDSWAGLGHRLTAYDKAEMARQSS